MSEELAEAGGAITVGLLAREMEQAHAGAPAVGHNIDEPCANCGTVRRGPYCHKCGQAGHVHRTAGALVHDIAHGVFHFEGKIWHTLPLLALRPGELTRRYITGQRVRFVSPIALFLFSVFLMFAVVSSIAGHTKVASPADLREISVRADKQKKEVQTRIAGLEAARRTTLTPASRGSIDAQLNDARSDLRALGMVGSGISKDGAFSAAALPRDLKPETGWRELDEAVARAARNPDLTLYKMKSYGYKYSWALIPISLPFLWLLFAFRRDVGFYDHAIFATYSLAFMSLGVVVLSILGWIGLPSGMIMLAALLVPPVHMYKQLKCGYSLSRLGAVWRTAALLVIITVTSTVYVGLLFYLGSE